MATTLGELPVARLHSNAHGRRGVIRVIRGSFTTRKMASHALLKIFRLFRLFRLFRNLFSTSLQFTTLNFTALDDTPFSYRHRRGKVRQAFVRAASVA